MKKFFITCIALGISLLSFAQEAVDFRINPEIGKTLAFNMTTKTDVDGEQSVIMDMTMRMEMLPIKKENDNFTLENTIKTINVDIDAGMMTMSYNSEKEVTDETTKMLEQQFSKIVDQKMTTVLSEKGKTIDFDLPASMAVQGFDANSFSNMSPSLPERAVAPGASWESNVNVSENPVLSKIAMTSTYREESPEGYIIDVTGKLFGTSGKECGSISGHYTLDKQTHFTKSSTLQTIMELQGAKITSNVEMNPAE